MGRRATCSTATLKSCNYETLRVLTFSIALQEKSLSPILSKAMKSEKQQKNSWFLAYLLVTKCWLLHLCGCVTRLKFHWLVDSDFFIACASRDIAQSPSPICSFALILWCFLATALRGCFSWVWALFRFSLFPSLLLTLLLLWTLLYPVFLLSTWREGRLAVLCHIQWTMRTRH